MKKIAVACLLIGVLAIGILIVHPSSASEFSGYKESHVVNVTDFGANGQDNKDDTEAIQKAISYAMTNGGGTVYVPAGNYIIEGTLYTHMDTYDADDNFSPLEIKGETPIYADIYNSKRKNVTRFIKKNEGVMLAVNYTKTKENVIPSVYRNLTVHNIAFYGAGENGTKYTKAMKNIKKITGIEMRNAAITLEDSTFWALYKGVAQPDKVNGNDNYCDQSVYRRLGFYHMGHTWLELQRSDATTIENINGYDMAKDSLYGIYARKGESFSIKDVLIAGKAMHLSKDFTLLHLNHVNNVSVSNIYAERVEGTLVNLDNANNVSIANMSIRHYGNTYVKGTNAKNIEIKNVYAHIEEGKKLSLMDTGNYSTYDNVKPANDFEFDKNSINVTYSSMIFKHGIHQTDGTFTEESERFTPRLSPDNLLNVTEKE